MTPATTRPAVKTRHENPPGKPATKPPLKLPHRDSRSRHPRYDGASQSLGQRKPLKQHTCRVAESQIAQVEAAAHPRVCSGTHIEVCQNTHHRQNVPVDFSHNFSNSGSNRDLDDSPAFSETMKISRQ
ncbi:hypothetical protein KL909_004584 [Ogataea angusta]|nr:hypothetical protein KL909_004584 [Ogataea angusta]